MQQHEHKRNFIAISTNNSVRSNYKEIESLENQLLAKCFFSFSQCLNNRNSFRGKQGGFFINIWKHEPSISTFNNWKICSCSFSHTNRTESIVFTGNNTIICVANKFLLMKNHTNSLSKQTTGNHELVGFVGRSPEDCGCPVPYLQSMCFVILFQRC